jgi:hypothetical protein
MKKYNLFILAAISVFTSNAQDDQQKLKTITLQAFESVSPATKQWFSDASDKHPPGEFDTTYARNKLKEKFTTTQLSEMAEMFVVMMAYLKMVQKEAREDRKIASMSKEYVMASKTEKLKLDIKSIDAGMQEAKEKADQAMQAAVTSLYMGIASGLIQVSASSFTNQNTSTVKKDTLKIKPVDPTRRVILKPAGSSFKKEPAAIYIKKIEAQLVVLKKSGI